MHPTWKPAAEGKVYAARSMLVGEEDLLKVGFSQNLDNRSPDGHYTFLFSRPDVPIPKRSPDDKTEGYVERSVLAYCEELGLRVGLENVGRRREGGGNGWTELIKFDLEAAQVIRTNLHKASPEAQAFLRIALRFAGNQPGKPNPILRFETLPSSLAERFPQRLAVPAPELLPHADTPWDGSNSVPDIDHPPEEPQARPLGSPFVYGGPAGYDDPNDEEEVDASPEDEPDVGDTYEAEGLTAPRGPGVPGVGGDGLHGLRVRRF